MDFLNFSVCWRWKMEPGSCTWSMLKTLNWPPNTFSLIGSFAFKYSSRRQSWLVIRENQAMDDNSELTSEIYSRRSEGSYDEYGHSDTETPLLVGVDLSWFSHLGEPAVWSGLTRTVWPHLDIVVCRGGRTAKQRLVSGLGHTVAVLKILLIF